MNTYSEYKKAWCKANPQKRNEANKRWRLNNPAKYLASKLKEAAKRKLQPRKKNDPEANRKAQRKWLANNQAKRNAYNVKHQAAKLQRIPKWLSKEQLKEIEQFYVDCKELQWLNDPSDPLEVDHIVPLKGKNVSGLHVPWNLQIIPKSLNCSKGNRCLL